eukprot:350049-Chlamydomonas_euryale.AAC.1
MGIVVRGVECVALKVEGNQDAAAELSPLDEILDKEETVPHQVVDKGIGLYWGRRGRAETVLSGADKCWVACGGNTCWGACAGNTC